MPRLPVTALAGALLGVCLTALPAVAQTRPAAGTATEPTADPVRPYRLNPVLDTAVILAASSLWLGPEFMHRELVPLGRCPCDPGVLNALDLHTAGVNGGDVTVPSNIATGALILAPLVLDTLDVWRSGGGVAEWVEDTLVLGEALVVGGALNELVKITFQRPRPALYGIDPGDPRLTDPEQYLSFFSLSAAEVFTAVVAGSVTYWRRHPTSPWRWVYAAAAGVLGAGFGATRVIYGKHFPTDVIAAGAVGSLVGMAVPMLHFREVPVTLGALAAPGAGVLTLTVTAP